MHLNFRLKSKGISIFFTFLLFFLWNGELAAELGTQVRAPDFSLKDLSDKTFTLKNHRGQIIVIDFWATWCVPCRKTIPELIEVNNKYKDKGVVVWGITLDEPDSYPNKYILDFKKQYNMNYTVLRSDEKVVEDYLGVDDVRVPIMFIIDREGKIVERHEGFDAGAAERLLKKHL